MCANGHRFTTYERREGFACPRCESTETRVDGVGSGVRGVERKRRCASCSHVFDTIERLSRPDIAVIKADGRREAFSHGKLFLALRAACSKRGVKPETIRSMADEIEIELRDASKAEIRSSMLAEMALDRLQVLDEVAYVRYASSYVERGGIEDMLTVISETLQRRELKSIRETNLPLVPDDMDQPV